MREMKKKIALWVLFILGISLFSGAFGFKIREIAWKIPYLSRLIPQKIETKTYTREIFREESVVIDVVKKVGPSVVSIGVVRERRIIDFFSDPFFDPFGFFRRPWGRKEEEVSIGTGFVISPDGLIVTNKHVVREIGAKYYVITSEGAKFAVKKIFRDPENDLAIIMIDTPGNLPPVKLGNSDDLEVGQFVIAIGNALGEFRNTVTTGVVSGLGRAIVAGDPFAGYQERLDNLIQTDAAINPGNSGGPLLNSRGEVIGVNVATSQGAENIGFAIPINVVKESLENFNKTGRFSRPFLGVRYYQVSRRVAILNEVPPGAYIIEVVEGSPADKAGIREEDIIVKFGGDKVTEKNNLAKLISRHKVGEEVKLTVWREGEEVQLQVTLAEKPAD